MRRSRTDLRERSERLEAAYCGAVHEIWDEPEKFLHRVAQTDERMRDVVRSLKLARQFDTLVGMPGRQAFAEPLLPAMLANYGAVSPAAATDTVLWTPNDTTQTHTRLQANVLQAGQHLRVRAGGQLTTPASAGTVTMNPRYGTTTAGVALGATTSISGSNSFTGTPWLIQAYIWVRSHGATATCMMLGTLESHGLSRDAIMGATAATIDTTTAQGVVFSVSDSVSSLSWTPTGILMDMTG